MKFWIKILSVLTLTVLYCEFIGDFVTTLSCTWPELETNSDNSNKNDDNDSQILKAMILADTHLLGPIRGNWLDKLYREWHMKRAFQAANSILHPDVIFVLGDLFDEGDLVNHEQFDNYVQRFHQHFQTPPDIPIISAVGNHDVGFHYKMHPYYTERFEKYFNNTGVTFYTLKNVHFIFINSMAMENDGCYFCDPAQRELIQISRNLECLKRKEQCDNKALLREHKDYSKPIIMQHFPTYRVSDKVCHTSDSPIFEKFRENWEVLSKESTDQLGKLLKPRLSFAGHSHHYCHSTNRWGVDEYTVASFSWRNKVNPSFLLATLTSRKHQVAKCDMLQQQTVYNAYIAAVIIIITIVIFELYAYKRNRSKKTL